MIYVFFVFPPHILYVWWEESAPLISGLYFQMPRKPAEKSLTLQAAEQTVKHQDSRNRQNCLGGKLGVGQSIKGPEIIPEEKRWNFQNDFPQNGKQERLSAHSAGLKDTHCQEVHTHERSGQAQSPQEGASIGNNSLVLHKL